MKIFLKLPHGVAAIGEKDYLSLLHSFASVLPFESVRMISAFRWSLSFEQPSPNFSGISGESFPPWDCSQRLGVTRDV
jgi:hypothetical protein